MKFFLFLCSLGFILLAMAPAAHAQSATEFLDKKTQIRQPTPAQMDESFAVYDTCQSVDIVRKYYDCDCVGSTFLQFRVAKPDEDASTLLAASRKRCANTVDVAGESYNNCLEWASTVRNDYEEYCTCFANTFAKSFTKNPSDSIRGRTNMMSNALDKCSTGQEIAEKRSRWNMIEALKRQGIYNLLFPSAKLNDPRAQTPSQK